MPIARINWDADRPESKCKFLIYGKAGNGKTWLASSAAACDEMSPALMLSAAGNPQAIWDWETKPHTFIITDLEDLNPFYDWFAAGQPIESVKTGKPYKFVEEHDLKPPYKTLIIDGMTELQRLTLSAAGGYKDLPIGVSPAQLQIQNFNPVLAHTTRMAALLFGLADEAATLPVHVIVTSLEWEKMNLKTQTTSIRPLIWGSGGEELAGYALSVCRVRQVASMPKRIRTSFDIKDKKYDRTTVAVWRPLPHVPFNKDQWNKLGDYTVDPTMQKLVDLIYGENQGPQQPHLTDPEPTDPTEETKHD